MAFRFWRRIKIAPGLTVNLSKSGASLSMGPRGAKVTVGRRGIRKTVGLTGTGLFYTKNSSWKKIKAGGGGTPTAQPTTSSSKALNPSWYEKLTISKDHLTFIEGLRFFLGGSKKKALELLDVKGAPADSQFMAGLIYLELKKYRDSERLLSAAAKNSKGLGKLFGRYKVRPELLLPVTEEMTLGITASAAGNALALAEARQALGNISGAVKALQQLVKTGDPVAMLSSIELLVEMSKKKSDNALLKDIISITKHIKNESPVHASILLYRARALRRLGLFSAARDCLTTVLRKKNKMEEKLLLTSRYERALVYRELGSEKRCRSELEKIYLVDPKFKETEKLLGI